VLACDKHPKFTGGGAAGSGAHLGNLVYGGLIGMPLAALGFLSPVVAGAAMALSSVSVVTNALLLRRWQPANNTRIQ
jgi:hypothetical protein